MIIDVRLVAIPALGFVEEFATLEALRQELPNEAIVDANLNQIKPLAPHEGEAISLQKNPQPAADGGGSEAMSLGAIGGELFLGYEVLGARHAVALPLQGIAEEVG